MHSFVNLKGWMWERWNWAKGPFVAFSSVSCLREDVALSGCVSSFTTKKQSFKHEKTTLKSDKLKLTQLTCRSLAWTQNFVSLSNWWISNGCRPKHNWNLSSDTHSNNVDRCAVRPLFLYFCKILLVTKLKYVSCMAGVTKSSPLGLLSCIA